MWETADGLAVDEFCCNNSRWTARIEYLLWSTKSMNTPPLATSGSAADTVPAALGQPGTEVLFGDSGLNDDARSGGRISITRWLAPNQLLGLELNYLGLGSEDTTFAASDGDYSLFGRPFFNTRSDAQDARLIASPGEVSGSLDIEANTKFQTFELLVRRAWTRTYCTNVDVVFGYRYAEVRDRIRIQESTLSLSGPTQGSTFDLIDQFESRSMFHGAELGVLMHYRAHPCWSWDASAKVAIGGTNHRSFITGQTTATDTAGDMTTTSGGLLTQPSNIGDYRWDDFATVSEVGLTVRRDLPCGVTASLGYSFVYWSKVARAGDQIDTSINPAQIPSSQIDDEAPPTFPSESTDFWAQGLRLGLEYHF